MLEEKKPFSSDSLIERSSRVDEAGVYLKEQFFGIDEQIDQVINAFKTWYLFPQFQDRPIVVNLYGMTGVGKTDLVNKLIKFMDLEKDKVYYNFAAIDELKAYDIEDEMEDEIDDKSKRKIFVYDEFQYASTLNELGNERDNRSGLKPFWELIDSGKLHKSLSKYTRNILERTIALLSDINKVEHIILENGKWVNEEQCMSHFTPWQATAIAEFVNINKAKYCSENGGKPKKSKKDDDDDDYNPYDYDRGRKTAVDAWLSEALLQKDAIEAFCKAYACVKSENIDSNDFYKKVSSMNFDAFMDFLTKINNDAHKGYELDFNESIIFVIANLDEAFNIHKDVNPDMSPDQFHKLTQKISVVDAKKSLQKRFRNEQIARLGNIHIIYPSFDSKTYKQIINKHLNDYKDKVETELGVKIEYDESIPNIIYKEGVFPTQGTRPVFSTIHELVKSKLPQICRYAFDNGLDGKFNTIGMSMVDKNMHIKYKDSNGNVIGEQSIKQTFRVEKLREVTKDNSQAICALHESGHFVAYVALTGELPEKVVSRAAETSVGGFVLHKLDTLEFTTMSDIDNCVCIGLAGYVAEKMVFGDNDRTTGASSDLEWVSKVVINALRHEGIRYPYATTRRLDGRADELIPDESSEYITNIATEIIAKCTKKVEELFKDDDWRGLLKESALYLAKNNSMTPKKMKTLYNKIPKGKRVVPKDNDYYCKLIEKL